MCRSLLFFQDFGIHVNISVYQALLSSPTREPFNESLGTRLAAESDRTGCVCYNCSRSKLLAILKDSILAGKSLILE